MISEKALQELVEDALTLGGWRWVHFRPGQTKHGWRTPLAGYVGWPDIFAVRDGECLALELKSERGKVNIEQAAWGDALGKVPGVYAKIVRPADVDEILRTILAKPTL